MAGPNSIEQIEIIKEDLYKKQIAFDRKYKRLSDLVYFSIPSNNILIKKYVDAKWNGYYQSIIYNVNEPKVTLCKTLDVLIKIESIVNKQFEDLTQQDIDNLQGALNDDTIYTHMKQPSNTKISYAYKKDIVRNMKQLWAFIMLYSKTELKKEIPNIVQYLKLRRQKQKNNLIQFITKEEVEAIVEKAHSQQMKAFFSVFFETGARVIEILKLRMQNCSYDEKKKTWIIKLPNEKGISTGKVPIELTFSLLEFNRWMVLKKEKPGDYVFQYSYNYVRKRLHELGMEVLNRHLTLKQFRKGATMYLINAGAPEQYIKAHLGWSASSNAISNYINQTAIKRPDVLNNVAKKDFQSDILRENEELKFKQKLHEDTLDKMRIEMNEMRKEQLSFFKEINKVNVRDSRRMLKAVFDDMKLKENS
jgi:integrase